MRRCDCFGSRYVTLCRTLIARANRGLLRAGARSSIDPLLWGEFLGMSTRPTQFKIPLTRPGSRVMGQRPCFSPTAP